jgi:hypothetical protein
VSFVFSSVLCLPQIAGLEARFGGRLVVVWQLLQVMHGNHRTFLADVEGAAVTTAALAAGPRLIAWGPPGPEQFRYAPSLEATSHTRIIGTSIPAVPQAAVTYYL